LAVQLALQQRAGPLLWRALRAAGVLAVQGVEGVEAVEGVEDQEGVEGVRGQEAVDLSSLKAVADAHHVESLLVLPRAVALAIGPLTDVGMEPVVLKGPAVATRYPEVGLRPMEDIDLLLPRSQHDQALRALQSRGWQVRRAARADGYDSVLAHRELPSIAVELHYGFDAPHERVGKLDAQTMWESRVPMECFGTEAFGLPLPEEIVFLALHAAKPFHAFSRIVWVADLGMIVGAAELCGAQVDWERVRSIAKGARCETIVGSALALAAHVGLRAPLDLFPLPCRGWRKAALDALVDESWPLRASSNSNFHLRYALTDDWWRRARLLAGSSHGMSLARRLRWTAAAPVEASTRWWVLRHKVVDSLGVPRPGLETREPEREGNGPAGEQDAISRPRCA
jgi:hypothetical protein